MIKAIRRFLHVFFNVRRIRCERERLKFGLFDVVSFTPDPTIRDLYIITRMDPDCVYAIRWVWYTFEGAFRIIGGEDKEVCILPDTLKDTYLVKNAQVNRANLLYCMHQEEIARFTAMLMGVYATDFPLCGIFLGNDGHVFIITETEGKIDTGHLTAQDLSASPLWGVLNFNSIQHYCRQRDIVYSRVTRAISFAELITALKGIQHPVVRADLCKRLINAINMSLSRILYYEPIAGGVATLVDKTTNLQPKGGEPPDNHKQGVKVK